VEKNEAVRVMALAGMQYMYYSELWQLIGYGHTEVDWNMSQALVLIAVIDNIIQIY